MSFLEFQQYTGTIEVRSVACLEGIIHTSIATAHFADVDHCQASVDNHRALAKEPNFDTLSRKMRNLHRLALIHLLAHLRVFRIQEGLNASLNVRMALNTATHHLANIDMAAGNIDGNRAMEVLRTTPATPWRKVKEEVEHLSVVVQKCFQPVDEIDTEMRLLEEVGEL
nr:hypothetical protein CFP56_52476 [Quercus suber]